MSEQQETLTVTEQHSARSRLAYNFGSECETSCMICRNQSKSAEHGFTTTAKV